MNLTPEQFAVLTDAATGELNHWYAHHTNKFGTRWYVNGVDKPMTYGTLGKNMTPQCALAADQCRARGWLHKTNEYRSGGSNGKTVQYRISTIGKVELQVYERQKKRARGELVE